MGGVDEMKLKDDNTQLNCAKKYMDDSLLILQEQELDDALYYAEWVKVKADIQYNKNIDKTMYVISNCIYWAFLGSNIGSEQNLHRPVLIIQSTQNSPVCSIIPLTLERLNDGYWYHVDLENTDSTALVEHLRVISKKRLDKPMRIGGTIISITKRDWNKINDQLSRLYTLKPLRV